MNLLANVSLFLIWGPIVYGRYAAIVGIWSVLSAFAALGIEKSALKHIPRYQRIGPYLTGYFIGLLFIACLVLLGAIVGIQMIASGDDAFNALSRLEVQVSLTCLLLGNSLCLSSIGRAHGKPAFDMLSSIALGLAILTALYLTYLFQWSSLGFTYIYNSILLIANLAGVVFLLPYTRFSIRKRRLLGLAYKWSIEAFLMSLNLVLATTAVSVVYLTFRLVGSFEEVSHFNIAALVFGTAYAFFHYCFGILLPSISVSIRERGVAWIYLSLSRNKKWLLSLMMAASGLAILGSSYLWMNHYGLPANLGLIWFWLLLTPFFLSAEFLTIIFEMLERPNIISSIGASALALLLITICAFVAIPRLGALGGIISLLVGEAAVSVFLLVRLKGLAGHAQAGA